MRQAIYEDRNTEERRFLRVGPRGDARDFTSRGVETQSTDWSFGERGSFDRLYSERFAPRSAALMRCDFLNPFCSRV